MGKGKLSEDSGLVPASPQTCRVTLGARVSPKLQCLPLWNESVRVEGFKVLCSSSPMLFCFSYYVYVWACSRACVCLCTCIWRLENSHRCHLPTLAFETGSFTEPGAPQWALETCLSLFPKGLYSKHAPTTLDLPTWTQGLKLRSSRLWGLHFSNWATAQPSFVVTEDLKKRKEKHVFFPSCSLGLACPLLVTRCWFSVLYFLGSH